MTKNLNITSVVISHDMTSVLRVAEYVAFLDEPKLSWKGTVDNYGSSNHKRPDGIHLGLAEYQI